MFIDTHSHLNFAAYDKDREDVIKRCLDNNVWMLNVGTNYYSSRKAVELAERYKEGVYATVGLHPINISQKSKLKSQNHKSKVKNDEDNLEESFDYRAYKKLANSPKVVAIGEIGLDYWYKPKTKSKFELFKQKQKEVFLKQLDLARELNLPVIFHCRLAHQDLLETLKPKIKNFTRHKFCEAKFGRARKSKIEGVMHSFVGTLEQLKRYLDFGFYIGFNGIIFKPIEGIDFEENIKRTPLERLLIETDCPFLALPEVENKRNEPLSVKWVAKRIADIKKESLEKIAETTFQNALNLFNIMA